jgi:hypothetical protein
VFDRRKGELSKLLIVRVRFQAHSSCIVGEGTMNKTISMRSSGGRSWFSDAIGGAWRLVKQSTHISTAMNASLRAELRALSEPHLPVLIHKRAKYLGQNSGASDGRWSTELDDFVTHMVWPYLFDVPDVYGKSSKRRAAEMLDEIIRAEQRRIAATTSNDDIPHTSRFDTSWVT